MNVYHQEDGLVFKKIQADTGISYIAVPIEEIKEFAPEYLVRHGDPQSGNCGYYPLKLIFSDYTARRMAAKKASKRPPSESWVLKMFNHLMANGLTIY